MPRSLAIFRNFCRRPHLGAHLATDRHHYVRHGVWVGPSRVADYAGLSFSGRAGPIEDVGLSYVAIGRRVLAVTLMAILAGNSAIAQMPGSCDLRLSVKLTPDVPNSRDTGFLSSLLGNQSGYQLTLQRQRGDSDIDLELTGPGPDYLCQSVVDAIRRDGRVVFVQVDPDPVLN
jgi:hypothetical protein